MRVTMRTNYAGALGNGKPGDVLDLPANEAQRLIGGGYAFETGKEDFTRKPSRDAEPQTATIAAAETAAAPGAAVGPAKPQPRKTRGE